MTDTGQRLVKAATEARDMASLAAENVELREQVSVLREAVKPMVGAAGSFDSYPVKDATQWFAYGGREDGVEGRVGALSVADLRAARSAYEATEPKE